MTDMPTVVQLLGPSAGGIRRHVAVLGQTLADNGWPQVLAGPPGVLDGLGVDDSLRATVDVPDSMSPQRIWRAIRQLRALPRPGLVHAHGLKAGWVAVLARLRCPIVLTIHNVVLDEAAGRGAAVQRTLERALFGRVDHIIAVSPEIVAHVGAAVPSERIDFVVPASPAPRPRRDRGTVRAALGVDDSAVLVVVAARLHVQKDLPLFIDAWSDVVRQCPGARAAIVGGGPLHDELARHIAACGVGESLQLAGPSDYAVDELAAADLVVLSSRWEGAPLVVAEAMQLGRPIVSTRVGVVPDMVGDGGIIVDVGDRAALADAMITFVSSALLRDSAGLVSLERGTVIYGAAPLVERVAEIYTEVLAR